MSIYEILVFAALFAAGLFAWSLYSADRKREARGEAPPPSAGQRMFDRKPNKKD